MNYEPSRRPSGVPFCAPDSIPAAPPLPAPRPLQRAREAATRFFGYYSRPASPQISPEDERSTRGGRTRYTSLSATQNATASHRTGLEINTLSINEKGTHALIGGKEIFKTIKVEDGRCAEDLNLRSAIRSTPTQASGKARQIYSIDIADVAWAKGDCGDYVAAATSSGKIILYDLGHAGLPAAQLHEHFRQVHRVTFNPHRGSLLLSGSQDGTVRLWDVRDVKHASTLQSKRKYSGQSDGVRDVKWSPTDGVDFAFGTDSGWIQRWDMRNLKTAKVKIPAHSETCNSIDWHPDGKHIVSASSDKIVRVWDFSTGRRQQKASWEIKTPYRVMNARWRPPCESSMPGDNSARLCTQLVTAYDLDHPVLHIWDFRRPALPFREISPYPSAPTDLLWHSQDLLWTVGKEGVFLQTDIQYASKIIDKRNLQAFAISPQNDLTIVTQKRPRRGLLSQRRATSNMASKSSSRSESPDRGLLSRSWTDDGIDQSFLSAVLTKREGRHSTASTMAPSISTSALNEMSFAKTLNLDDALLNPESFRPTQVFIHGPLPLAQEPEIFAFLARNYRIDWKSIPLDAAFVESYGKLLDHNAQCAYTAGMYRTAQTWRMVKTMMTNHLKKRAEIKQKQRTGNKPGIQEPLRKGTVSKIASSLMGERTKSPTPTPASMKPTSAITQQLALANIASNQSTPLAKPVTHVKAPVLPQPDILPDLEKEGRLALPPSISPAGNNNSRRSSAGDDEVYKEEKSFYLPEDDDEDFEATKPFYMVEMLRELVTNYAGKGDAQTAAHFLLLVGPLLPRTLSLPVVEISATVTAYVDCFTTAGYTHEEIESILSDNFDSVISSGLQPMQIEAILSTYHEQLMKRRLLNEATILRNLCFPAYPSVYEDALKDNHVHLRCGACGKPISTGMQSLRCESCRVKQSICQICWCDESPYEEKTSSKLLSTCLLCNYTGHAACLQAWYAEGGGGCPGCSTEFSESL